MILKFECVILMRKYALLFSNVRMKADGEKLQKLLDENYHLLGVEEQSTGHWDRYLLTVDHRIERGLVDAVHCSLTYLLDSCEPRSNQFPLLEAQLVLQDQYLLLQPSAEQLSSLAMALVSDLLHISTFIPRLAPGSPSYLVLLHIWYFFISGTPSYLVLLHFWYSFISGTPSYWYLHIWHL